MGQTEVVDFLESQEGIFTSRQIAEAIDAKITLVHHIMPRLLKSKEIGFIELDRFSAAKFLGMESHTRRLRFFFRLGLDFRAVLKDRSVYLR